MPFQCQAQWRIPLPLDTAGRPFRSWLSDRGSLTERLRASGGFAVVVLNQYLGTPCRDEVDELSLKAGQHAWIREVALHCNGQPVVFAHSVLPRRPSGPMIRWLARLGNRSLGALLFAHPRFVRGGMQTRRLDARHPLFQPAVRALHLPSSYAGVLWARRSLFTFNARSLLVTEVFSPIVVKLQPITTKGSQSNIAA